jgi:hypothetical protein
VTLGCAQGGARPVSDPTAVPDGVRLLFDARVTAADGQVSRFRLAVAFRPPDRLRLEALGPAGGTRLVIATDGAGATALLVADRRFDRAPATAEGMARWTGLPLGPADLGAILQGKPPCGGAVIGNAPGAAPCAIRCLADPPEPWSRSIDATGARRIELVRVGEAAPARLADSLFAPEVPAGFEPIDLGAAPAGEATLLDGQGRP